MVLDDGFQNPEPIKDLSIVVVDAVAGFGNGRVIPAGPLREPVAAGLARSDLMLAIGPPMARRTFVDARAWPVPVAEGRLAPLEDWRGRRVLAVAGIGRPGKFFDTLREAGAEIAGQRPLRAEAEALADHQPIPPALLARLQGQRRPRSAPSSR